MTLTIPLRQRLIFTGVFRQGTVFRWVDDIADDNFSAQQMRTDAVSNCLKGQS